jgi:hypothetical protein
MFMVQRKKVGLMLKETTMETIRHNAENGKAFGRVIEEMIAHGVRVGLLQEPPKEEANK